MSHPIDLRDIPVASCAQVVPMSGQVKTRVCGESTTFMLDDLSVCSGCLARKLRRRQFTGVRRTGTQGL